MKTHHVSWRLTEEDAALLAQLAARHGISQIGVVRMLVRREIREMGDVTVLCRCSACAKQREKEKA